jgi:hypothetical protein
LFSIGVATAQNVVKAYGTPPVPNFVAAGLAAALGVAQAAIVLAKAPKFAKGTTRVTGGEKGKDSVVAMLMPDEAVVPADIAQHPAVSPLLGGLINRTMRPQDLASLNHKQIGVHRGGVHRGVSEKHINKLINKVSNLKQVHVTVDRGGVGVETTHAGTRTKILNKYFVD